MRYLLLALLLILLAIQVRAALARPKWEYKSGSLDGELCTPEFLAASKTDAPATEAAIGVLTSCLNRMGDDGWELVSMGDTEQNLGATTLVLHHTTALFKRQKPFTFK